MKSLFSRHRARLTEAEDRETWETVRARTTGSQRRRWSLFGAPMALVTAGAAVAVTVVVVSRDGGPTEQLEAFRANEAVEAPTGPSPGKVGADEEVVGLGVTDAHSTDEIEMDAEPVAEASGGEAGGSAEGADRAALVGASGLYPGTVRDESKTTPGTDAAREGEHAPRVVPERTARAVEPPVSSEPAPNEPAPSTPALGLGRERARRARGRRGVGRGDAAGGGAPPPARHVGFGAHGPEGAGEPGEKGESTRRATDREAEARELARARLMLSTHFGNAVREPFELVTDSDSVSVAMGRVDGSGAVVRGWVVDDGTGQPLAYTNVIVPGSVWGTITRDDGSFSLELPREALAQHGGPLALKASYVGYEPLDVSLPALEPGTAVAVELAMRAVPADVLAQVEVSADRQEPIDTTDSASAESGAGSENAGSLPTEEISDAIALKGGVVARSGQLFFRHGRASEAPVTVGESPAPGGEGRTGARRERPEDEHVRPPLRPYSTGPINVGGSHPVNDTKIDAMFFQHYGVNPFIDAGRDALSTFAMDVDNASYTIARSYLQRGVLPPVDAIRVEEFVNAFDHGYPPPRGDIADLDPELTRERTFAIHLDAAPSPLHANTVLMRVGLKGREIAEYDRKPLNLTFVIDVSGSMEREGRLELVKRSLIDLLDRLRPDDEVAIVAYSNSAYVVTAPTPMRFRHAIVSLIQGLRPRGGTNAEAGLRVGYTLAEQAYDRREENRVILCSDGVANVGNTGAGSILDEIKRCAGRGIYMTAIGVGMGNYNDVLLEQLANDGDGNYFYVDSPREAHRVLVENMVGTMQTIARDAKIQVEFDPRAVRSYRLLGYENRDVRDEDFRNDRVDAGEVGAGHEVTALFEVVLDRGAERRSRVAVVRIRYEDPDTGEVTEDYDTLRMHDVARSFERAPASFRLDAAVAGFAEILRGSYWAKEDELADVIDIARDVDRETRGREEVAELVSLMQTAERLWPDTTPVPWREREREWHREE